jgi:hypothetical protein
MDKNLEPDTGLLAYATSELRSGRSPEGLRANLLNRGTSEDAADRIVQDARDLNRRRGLRAGIKYLVIGIACGVLGIAITGSTYSAAQEHGGAYVVTFGLLGFGAGYTLAGLIRLLVAAVSGK